MGLFLCLTSFVLCFLLGLRARVLGLGAVLLVGYLYGIVRANFLDSYTHYIFDAAVIGFYLSLFVRGVTPAERGRGWAIEVWVKLLVGWAVLIALVPIQHPLIQLVGLRGNAFLVPFLLVGAWLDVREARRLAFWLALLNLMALGFGAAEFFLGVPAFFPENAVTGIIYKSNDVAGYSAYRIPACFANAHSYAGTMAVTLPWLVGAFAQSATPRWQKALIAGGILAALLGNFLSATRINLGVLLLYLLVVTFSGQVRSTVRVAWVVMLAGIGFIVSSEERLQRFTTLQDTEQIVARVEGSVNLTVLEMVVEYPLGNGMGAGGTSIPFFLAELLENPVVFENEYCRIHLEQGLPGLFLWVAFVAWVAMRRQDYRDPWLLGRRLLKVGSLGSFALALLGTGLMTSIPNTVLFFLGIGYLTAGDPALQHRPFPAPSGEPARAGPAPARGTSVAVS